MFEGCVSEIDATIFRCQDRFNPARRVIFSNPKRVKLRKVQVDGCVDIAGKRCDFLVIRKGVSAWFLELKGRDVSHGVAQLKATVTSLKDEVKGLDVDCYLVCSASPAAGFVQKYSLIFKRDTGARLKIRTRQAEIVVQ